jgi:hypothetical protein
MPRRQSACCINIENPPSLYTTDGTELEQVDNFRYLVSWVKQLERNIIIQKSLAWQALNGMSRIWRSNLSSELKLCFFKGTVESILLYGCEAWALTQSMEHSLDGEATACRILLLPSRTQCSTTCSMGAQPWHWRRGRPKAKSVDTRKRNTGVQNTRELSTLMTGDQVSDQLSSSK